MFPLPQKKRARGGPSTSNPPPDQDMRDLKSIRRNFTPEELYDAFHCDGVGHPDVELQSCDDGPLEGGDEAAVCFVRDLERGRKHALYVVRELLPKGWKLVNEKESQERELFYEIPPEIMGVASVIFGHTQDAPAAVQVLPNPSTNPDMHDSQEAHDALRLVTCPRCGSSDLTIDHAPTLVYQLGSFSANPTGVSNDTDEESTVATLRCHECHAGHKEGADYISGPDGRTFQTINDKIIVGRFAAIVELWRKAMEQQG